MKRKTRPEQRGKVQRDKGARQEARKQGEAKTKRGETSAKKEGEEYREAIRRQGKEREIR